MISSLAKNLRAQPLKSLPSGVALAMVFALSACGAKKLSTPDHSQDAKAQKSTDASPVASVSQNAGQASGSPNVMPTAIPTSGVVPIGSNNPSTTPSSSTPSTQVPTSIPQPQTSLVNLSMTTMTLGTGGAVTINVVASFNDGSQKNAATDATCNSSDPNVVTISSGSLIAIQAGSATISCSYQGFSASAAAIVTNSSAPAPTTLALSIGISGSGNVVGAQTTLNCPSVCSQRFAPGTTVPLTAVAASGYSFSGWSGGCSGAGGCVVSINADTNVTASFTKNAVVTNPTPTVAPTPPPQQPASYYTLNVQSIGGGTVSAPSINCGSNGTNSSYGTCSWTYATGYSVTLTATPAIGKEFVGYTSAGTDCVGLSKQCSLTMSTNRNVVAVFQTINLAGTWWYQGQLCSISQNGTALVFTNELNQPSNGYFDSSPFRLVATDWGIGAIFSDDRKSIQFDSGALWTRTSAP